MPAIEQTADTSGKVLWVEHEHKVSELVGLKINNQHTAPEKLRFVDCFITDTSNLLSGGGSQAAEDFKTSIRSGRCRLEITVPSGEFQSLGPDDLRECRFLGTAMVWGDATTSDCVIVATYTLR